MTSIKLGDIKGCPENMQKDVVVLRKLTYGDENDVIDRLVEFDPATMKPLNNVRFGSLRNLALIYGIESAPFFGGEGGINWALGMKEPQFNNRRALVRNIPGPVGDALFKEIISLNPSLMGKTEDDIKKSLASLETKAETPEHP